MPSSDLETIKATLDSLRLEVGRLSFFAPAAIPILADIVKGPTAWTGRADKITKKRTETCVVTVAVDVKYEVESYRNETDGEGKVVKTCTTYKITTKLTVSETCSPGGSVELGSAQHVCHREYCDKATDEPVTGESKGFDGKTTDTLAYPHGTKVTVEKEEGKEKVTITVAFPDGTTTSMTYPK